jgi:hypothetical protein
VTQKPQKKRGSFWYSWWRLSITIGALLASQLVGNIPSATAVAGVPYRINFQGRLADNNGNILADGLYNIKFRIFDALTAGTNLWEGDRVITATDYRIQLTNGLFSIQFGDTAQGDPALTPALFNSSAQHYLEIELPSTATNTCSTNGCASFTEGPFTPRQPIASSPYAFNSDALDGLDSTQFARTDANNTLTGTQLFKTTAFDIQNAAGTVTALSADTTNGRLGVNKSSPTFTLDVAGDINTTTSYRVGGTQGSTTTCTGGQVLQNSVVTGGIITGGSCVASGGGDLQAAYTASSSPATINLNTSAKDFVINATDQAVDPNILLNLQCVTCSAGAGRFAVQGAGTDVLTVNPVGSIVAAPTAGQNFTINLPASSGVRVSSAVAPTVDQFNIDNTASSGVTTAGVNGLSINYKGGAAAIEAAALRIDFTPGTTAGGTWEGLRIKPSTGAAAGVTAYGFKFDNVVSNGGTDEAMYVGTGWDIGVDIQSGGIQLAAQTDPAVPTAGNLRVYAKDIAGRVLPKWVGPAGVDTPFQANLGFNRVDFAEPNGTASCTTGGTGFGATLVGSGTCTAPNPTSANLKASTRRVTYSSGVTAGTVSYQHQGVLQVWRGNAASLGGFFFTTRFGLNATVAGNRAFVGMSDSVANPTNVDPTTTTAPGKIGLAINVNTGNWKLVNNTTGSAPTVLDLGASFTVNTTDLLELILFSAPNGTSIGYRVTNVSTNAVISGSLTTNLPTNTTFLAPAFWITNNATAASATIDWGGWYLESDQ